MSAPDSESSKPRPPALKPSFIPSAKAVARVITSVESPAPHRGWHSRGYLPHWDHPGMIQSLNFRLADAMPQTLLHQWRMELGLLGAPASLPAGSTSSKSSREEHDLAGRDAGAPREDRQAELRRRVENYLDAGHGACWLGRPEIAELVEGALLRFDAERYSLLAWCVMPNHVHALIETRAGFPMGKVLHSWKSFTSSKANKLLGQRGEFWQREYLDRYVRNAEHFEKVIAYIEENPVKAGLAQVKTAWRWSSARFRLGAPASLPAGS